MGRTKAVEQRAGQAGSRGDVPEPQVPERALRSTYTAKYKRGVLAENEACVRAGRGALLRRESDSAHALIAARARGRHGGRCNPPYTSRVVR